MADDGRRWRWATTRLAAATGTVERLPARLVIGPLALVLLVAFVARPGGDALVTVTAEDAGRAHPDHASVREAVSPVLDDATAAGPDLAHAGRAPVVPDPVAGEASRSADVGTPEDLQVVPLALIVRDAVVDLDALGEVLADADHVAPAVALLATSPDAPDRDLEVIGVDGTAVRPLTPAVTATADGVWERLADGDALVTHELAEELDLELGGGLLLRTGTATVPLRIGAFAATGAPPIADVVVPVDVAADLGSAATNTLLVGTDDDPTALRTTLSELTGGDVEDRHDPQPPVSGQRTAATTGSGHLEPFSYTSHADGRITIHGDWVARNITRVQLPGMPDTSCHRVMVPQLLAAVEELVAVGVYDHLDPSQFAGCFVARHIDWNPDRPLSMHAWGLAIDVNARDNPLGVTPVMDRRVVEVFERWGFDWGGRWSRPDGMHFELARIVPTS